MTQRDRVTYDLIIMARDAGKTYDPNGALWRQCDEWVRQHGEALGDQPEAPVEASQCMCAKCKLVWGQPEAPKVPAAVATFSKGRCLHCGASQPTNFASADGCADCGRKGPAPVAEDDYDLQAGGLGLTDAQVAERYPSAHIKMLEVELDGSERDLAAATTKIAELEGRLEKEQERSTANADMYAAANARADAAERERDRMVEEAEALADGVSPISRDLGWAGSVATIRRHVEDDRANAARTEAKLAARVKELEETVKLLQWHNSDFECTPEEREVLKAMGDIPGNDVERWSATDGYPPARALWETELANRAAKAKREAT